MMLLLIVQTPLFAVIHISNSNAFVASDRAVGDIQVGSRYLDSAVARLFRAIVLFVMSNLAVGTVVLASVSMAPKVLPLSVLSVMVVAVTREPDIPIPKASLLLTVLPMMCNVPVL